MCVQIFGFNLGRGIIKYIKEISRKEKVIAKKIWGLGEKLCRNDFSRR